MKILVAENAGFCFGVKRAIELAENGAKSGKIKTIGPLIHNNKEIERLESLGVYSSGLDEIEANDTVLIRTHGVGPEIYEELAKKSARTIDATCPFVSKAQQMATQAINEGYQVIILGNQEHPEVQGICSWTGNTALVVKSWHDLKDAAELPDRVAILAQTTEKEEKFLELAEHLRVRVKDLKIIDTICTATKLRQQAVEKLAQQVDVMLIIGDKHSSNTRKLWEICQKHNTPGYLIEDPVELQANWFLGKNSVGISAGASTPAWIVEEVKKKMEELKEQLATVEETTGTPAEQAETTVGNDEAAGAQAGNNEQMPSLDDDIYFRDFQPGDLVKGKVVKVTADEALVEIGGKSEGILRNTEFTYRKVDPREVVAVGDEILVEVLKEDKEGNILLSRKRAAIEEAYNKLEQANNNNEIITAKVTEVVKGGLVVDVGVRGFVPASQVERAYVEDLSQYLNLELQLKIIELNRDAKKVVLSRRVVLEEEYQKQREALWNELAEGQVRKGTVKRLTSFGAFVDLGGIEGLLHVSEMSWTHVKSPADVVKEGDELEVYIIKVDRENERISLSLKNLLKSPWELAQEKYKAGMICEGKVARIVPFGAFIELEPGVDGLVHISQLANKRVNKVEDVLKAGETVKVKILEIDPEKQRISLSIKEAAADLESSEVQAFIEQQPEEEASVTIGEILQEDEAKDKE